ncbi:MAG TPA: hypothetical protein VMV60_08080 [Thermoanaerobaculia bacterium]|nr:hypothetical protein [Thermoanaerobaculia bacterium]
MAKMRVEKDDLVAFLDELEKRVRKAREWANRHGKKIEIEAPGHLGPILGLKDNQQRVCGAPPPDADDQALVEILALVQTAKKQAGPKG